MTTMTKRSEKGVGWAKEHKRVHGTLHRPQKISLMVSTQWCRISGTKSHLTSS